MAVAVAVVLAAALPATASNHSAPRRGAAWLNAHVHGDDGFAADALVAIRAAGSLSPGEATRRAAALRSGARSYATGAGQAAKVVLALAAARSGSARCAGGKDLRIAMGRDYTRGRYGRNAFDQALSMLAIHALHERVPRGAIAFLRRARGAGGWNVLLTRSGTKDDVSSTAIAIVALRRAGVSAHDRALRAALRWLRAQRTRSGGFALGRRDRNEANSTALAIEAQRIMGSRDGRAARVLRGLQRADGSFQYTAQDSGSRVIATTESVVALAGHVPPVVSLRHRPAPCT